MSNNVSRHVTIRLRRMAVTLHTILRCKGNTNKVINCKKKVSKKKKKNAIVCILTIFSFRETSMWFLGSLLVAALKIFLCFGVAEYKDSRFSHSCDARRVASYGKKKEATHLASHEQKCKIISLATRDASPPTVRLKLLHYPAVYREIS